MSNAKAKCGSIPCDRPGDGDAGSAPKRVGDLEGAAESIRRIHDLLYLDMQDGREFWNPDKPWDAETIERIAEIINSHIPRPTSQRPLDAQEAIVAPGGEGSAEGKGLYLELFHGRADRHQSMEDWGREGPILGPFHYAHTTYADDIKLALCSAAEECELQVVDGLVYYDGAWYGDWSVFVGLNEAAAARLAPFEKDKAVPPEGQGPGDQERTLNSEGTGGDKPTDLQVILTVSGGVADVLYKPPGVSVLLHDYDVEESDEGEPIVGRDFDGLLCCTSRWDAQEEVADREHWPEVKNARQGSYRRGWKCPRCGFLVACSYEDLAESGSPLCPDCDIPLEMQ